MNWLPLEAAQLASALESGVAAARAAAEVLTEPPMTAGAPTDDRKNSKLTDNAVREVLLDFIVILSTFHKMHAI